MPFSSSSEIIFTAGYDSPAGHLELAMSERGLTGLAFGARRSAPWGSQGASTRGEHATVRWVEKPERFIEVRGQLDEYFAGRRRHFDLPLDLRGPEFYLRCWQALLRIPYGETWSYARLAAEVGSPRSSRAAGQANHHNPIAIIVPCHRVIASDGSLAGFGGGLEVKQFLLKLEGARIRPSIPAQGELFTRAV
jgi:methylated-DNA-[protein]-cysteine S-methyltransferase